MTDQSSQDVFSNEDKPKETPSQESASSGSNYADLLASIKNERGEQKYDSLEKALEALQHSQSYIPQLKTEAQKHQEELEKVRAELDKRASVEDVVSRLTGNQKPQDTDDTPTEVNQGLNEKTVEELFEQLMQKKQTETAAQENRRKVNDALNQAYGDKVSEVIAEKAKELGITPKEMGEMASQKPGVVLALFNSKAPRGASTTTSSINVPPYRQQQEELQRPSKSLLSGASTKEQVEYMRQVKAAVYKQYGVEDNS